MEPEERIYAALSGQKPDRIPTLPLAHDPNIINQVPGLPTVPALQKTFRSELAEPWVAAFREVNR